MQIMKPTTDADNYWRSLSQTNLKNLKTTAVVAWENVYIRIWHE